MNRDEALAHARSFVGSKYPRVPPVGLVQHVTERYLRLLRQLFAGSRIEIRESVAVSGDSILEGADQLSGKWLVTFGTSWDTDAVGMAHALVVLVDDSDASVRQISPE